MIERKTFLMQHVVRMSQDINKPKLLSALPEFPKDVVIHDVAHNFLLDKEVTPYPSFETWFAKLPPSLKRYINIVKAQDPAVIEYPENFTMGTNQITAPLQRFRLSVNSFAKEVVEIKGLPRFRFDIQNFVNYNPLYFARVFGAWRTWRRTNFVIDNILNTIPQLEDRFQIIPIPTSSFIPKFNQFTRSNKEHSRATIKFPDDPYYIFLVHLMGYLWVDQTGKDPTPSHFNNLDKSHWDNVWVFLYSDTKYLGFNMGLLKELNGNRNLIYMRLFRVLTELALDHAVVTPITTEELEDEDPTDEITEETVADTEEDPEEEIKAAIQVKVDKKTKVDPIPFKEEDLPEIPKAPANVKILRLDEEIKKHQAKVLAKEPKVAKEEKVNPLKAELEPLVDQALPTLEPIQGLETIVEEVNQIPTISEKIVEIPKVQGKRLNVAIFEKSKEESERQKYHLQTFQTREQSIQTRIESNEDTTPAQKKALLKIANKYKDIVFDGEKVEDILKSAPDIKMDVHTVDALKGQIPDESMLHSSVVSFDKVYQEKMMKKHFVETVSAFNTAGMFLTNIEKEDISDELNSAEKYRLTYVDEDMKSFTINVIMPLVNSKGYFLNNGVEKMIKKQRTINPICKTGPYQVTMSSDFSKNIVRRNTTVAHSLNAYVKKLLEKNPDVHIVFGESNNPKDIVLPYDYTTLGDKFTAFLYPGRNPIFAASFNYQDRFKDTLGELHNHSESLIQTITNIEDESNSILFMASKELYGEIQVANEDGSLPKKLYGYFITATGEVKVYDLISEVVVRKDSTLLDEIFVLTGSSASPLTEWVDFKIKGVQIPVIFMLCYKYGLSHMLEYTETKYEVYSENGRIPNRKPSDLILKFMGGRIRIPRAPLFNYLLFGGLMMFKNQLTNITMEDMDLPETYFDILLGKNIRPALTKDIDNMFDLWVDSRTRDILFEMDYPTNYKDLLLKAVALLTTEDHLDVAANANMCYRSLDRINGTLYRSLAHALARYRNKPSASPMKFSIKEFEVKQSILQDNLTENVATINPIAQIKYQTNFTHGGFGGRSDETFQIDDRKYPEDGYGVVCETTVDSYKVGFSGNLSMNPTIDNVYGLTINKPLEELSPTNLFSHTTLLVPGALNNTPPRTNFINIQMGHWVPCSKIDLSRHRTGYELVLPHLTQEPFAKAAEDDGVIEKIDHDAKLMLIQYKNGEKVSVLIDEQYCNNSSGGFYTTQEIKINDFNEGDKFTKGDILTYNPQFFVPDPYRKKQVAMGLGVMVNIALEDIAENIEDGLLLTEKKANDLKFHPVHIRDVVLDGTMKIWDYKKVGSLVKSTDNLMVFDETTLDDEMFENMEGVGLEALERIQRNAPSAHYSGKIVKIEAFHRAEFKDLHVSAVKIIKEVNTQKSNQAKLAKGTKNASDFPQPKNITSSDRIGITEFLPTTVMFRFYIQQDMSSEGGDKIVLAGSLKAVETVVVRDEIVTTDGIIVDGIFSTRSLSARIVLDPFLGGFINRVAECVENQILTIYDNE